MCDLTGRYRGAEHVELEPVNDNDGPQFNEKGELVPRDNTRDPIPIRYKFSVTQHLAGKTAMQAYRFCRKAGLAPWCSVKYALLYGTR